MQLLQKDIYNLRFSTLPDYNLLKHSEIIELFTSFAQSYNGVTMKKFYLLVLNQIKNMNWNF